MSRIQPIDRSATDSGTQKVLDGIETKLGMLPNMISTMAHSPAALRGYLGLSQALSGGQLPADLRERIALTVSEINGCGYCLAAHSAIGGSLGLSADDLRDARAARSADSKTDAALQFARQLVDTRGNISDEDVQAVQSAGFGESEITEIISHVALHTFTNYFNKTAQTVVDFPAVDELAGV